MTKVAFHLVTEQSASYLFCRNIYSSRSQMSFFNIEKSALVIAWIHSFPSESEDADLTWISAMHTISWSSLTYFSVAWCFLGIPDIPVKTSFELPGLRFLEIVTSGVGIASEFGAGLTSKPRKGLCSSGHSQKSSRTSVESGVSQTWWSSLFVGLSLFSMMLRVPFVNKSQSSPVSTESATRSRWKTLYRPFPAFSRIARRTDSMLFTDPNSKSPRKHLFMHGSVLLDKPNSWNSLTSDVTPSQSHIDFFHSRK